ncbi:MAG: PQQ-dependent sugar dehydrogenase [Planctomycetales bacterium]|nr:PQQ-dependent sugar dehydrogenase [Planctomycetales bacterium]
MAIPHRPRNHGALSRGRRPVSHSLHVEHLEPRHLLAGDVFLINFQFDEVPTPDSYVRDVGALFGDRGNGLTYGWSSDHTDVSRDRGVDLDQRTDTLIHFHQNANWELQLPNGDYEVTVVVGDPGTNDGVHTVNVEGVSFFAAVPDGNTPLLATQVVTVADGRLTLDQGAAADKATRIDYIHVIGVPSAPNAAPAAPTVTEPAAEGQQVNPTDVHMEAVGFSDGDGNAHKSSDWEIWTTGASPELVWATIGIQGVERLHTHLGDGFFQNSHAGRLDLLPNTDYQLRVRFRDDAGSVSAYSVRNFHTTSATTTFPLQIEDVVASPAPAWDTVFGAPVELPDGTTILSPGDAIVAIDTDGNSSYPGGESPPNAVDGTLAKYLNFGEINSGFIVTPATGSSTVTGFQITTANDADERDPTAWQLFGTNSPVVSTDNSTGAGESWTLIDSGSVALPLARDTLGPLVAVTNTTAYTSYRMVFTGVRNSGAANSMQIGEIQFFADDAGPATPPSLRMETPDGTPLLRIDGDSAPGNLVTDSPTLPSHKPVRIVIDAGSRGLFLGQSDLTFTDETDNEHTIFLPEVDLAAGESLTLWAALDGATYFGTAGQTAPNFDSLARAAQLDLPFIALQSGFIVEEVAGGMQLPTNIAFVPNPGSAPGDPLFYVTELYGTIKVVTNDGTTSDYATGLLNFNPTGNFPGSGEQGLTGIVVDPATGDVIVSRVRDTDGQPGGAHHPQVVKFTSLDGGLTAATETVLLDMVGESQGQSHQISNVSIGPDGMLYVHNGDGFDASTALNLDSYRGKILRMTLDGQPLADNPFYNAGNGINSRDYVYAYGFRNPFGGAWRAADGTHYEVENGPSSDRFAKVNPGQSYQWDGSNASMFTNALYNWDPAHAPVNIAFVQPETFGGSGFPSQYWDQAFVSESGPTYGLGPQVLGKRIVGFQLDAQGNVTSGPETLVEYVGMGRGTVVGLAAGPDGLYFTELYKDVDAVTPIDAGARVFRVRYIGGNSADFTGDGFVDGADLSVWETNFGAPSGASRTTGDADADHDVDGADFLLWQRSYSPAPAAANEGLVAASSGSTASLVTAAASFESEPAAADSPDESLAAMPSVAAACDLLNHAMGTEHDGDAAELHDEFYADVSSHWRPRTATTETGFDAPSLNRAARPGHHAQQHDQATDAAGELEGIGRALRHLLRGRVR